MGRAIPYLGTSVVPAGGSNSQKAPLLLGGQNIILRPRNGLAMSNSPTALLSPALAKDRPGVTAITVTYRDQQHPHPLIGPLEQLAILTGKPVQLIIVRNQPIGQQSFKSQHIVITEITNQDNCGFARAFNQGAASAHYDILLSLNCDTSPSPAALITILGHLWNHEKDRPVLVAPTLETDGQLYFGRYFYNIVSLIAARSGLRNSLLVSNGPDDVDWVLGACFAIWRKPFMALGGFDERLFLYFEDVDLCWRIWEIGGRVTVLSDIVVPHAHGRASWKFGPPLWYHIRSAIQFFKNHPRSLVGRSPHVMDI